MSSAISTALFSMTGWVALASAFTLLRRANLLGLGNIVAPEDQGPEPEGPGPISGCALASSFGGRDLTEEARATDSESGTGLKEDGPHIPDELIVDQPNGYGAGHPVVKRGTA